MTNFANITFMVKITNDIVPQPYRIDCSWTCSQFNQEVQKKIIRDYYRNKKQLFLFSRHPNIIPNEIVPDSQVNIVEFINIGNRNWYNFCFSVLEEDLLEVSQEGGEEEDTSKCVICFTNKKNTVFLPCRHLACCYDCSRHQTITECVICRTHIQDRMQIFT
jgi:hypothetical protein